MHTRVYVYIYVFVSLSVLFWFYLTAVYLTLCFSSIQVDWNEQQPVVGPATRRFCRAFIAAVSVRVSRGSLQSAALQWKCWMCVSVCTYEGICPMFDRTWNAFSTWIGPQDCIYKHEYTRTYMYRQTERHSGWISEIVAAHTLAHVVHTLIHTLEMRLSCGGHMHAHVHVHACVPISFLFFGHPWAVVVTSVTLIRSRSLYNHTYKNAYLYVFVYIYIFVFCFFVFLSIYDRF